MDISSETKSEIIKSLAYGLTAEEVAEIYELPLIPVKELAADHEYDIQQEKKRLKKAGWTE